MNEARRTAYLAAMGIDGYVSRTQLPGAAPTCRREVASVPIEREASPAHTGVLSGSPVVVEATAPPADATGVVPRRQSAARPVPGIAEQRMRTVPRDGSGPARFSLAAIAAGGILWLEELAGMPLAREQVQLVAAMARAVAASGAEDGDKPEVTQFNWPIHTNTQFDQSEDAARAALAGFLGRRLEQHQCRGLVLLGDASARRTPLDALPAIARVQVPSTREMLENPKLKKTAWIELRGLVGVH